MIPLIDQRKWHWLDSFIFLVRTIWISAQMYEVYDSFHSIDRWFILLWMFSAYLVPYAFYRPGYINFPYYLISEIVITGTLYIYLNSQFEIIEMYGFLFVPMITVGYACQKKTLIWIGPITFITIIFVGTIVGDISSNWGNLISIIIDTSIFYGIGFFLGRMVIVNNENKKLIASIEEKNKDLEYYSKKIEELTIREERNRVSQDLHDTVGHIFTSVITSLDALPYLYRANKEEAEKSIKEISSLARNGLEDVRKTIHQMAPIDNQSFIESINELIEDFMKHTSVKVDVNIHGEVIEVGERIKLAIIRCIQEALTNAKRHGEATYIKVNIAFLENNLVVNIEDNGKGCNEVNLGFGLRSMKDRVTALAGTINFNSKINDGMQITCSIPLNKDVKFI